MATITTDRVRTPRRARAAARRREPRLVTWRHPFIAADQAGAQCGIPYCWGWRDDPRHWTA